MRLEEIRIVGGNPVPATIEEVTQLEARLNLSFPAGYAEYVTTLGAGVLSSYIRVYPPQRIGNEYRDFQDRWNEYWFWDDGHRLLTKEQARECIIIADTLDGDELVFHPSEPERLLVLPRHSEMIYQAGSDLYEALDWLCTSGVLTEPFHERDFEPFDDQET